MSRVLPAVLGCAVIVAWSAAAAGAANVGSYRLAESIDLDKVPSWFPVGFSLLTHEGRQYVAYYDAKHHMTVASRKLDEKKFRYVKLPTKIGWDSHNSVTMALDANGCVHLSGNMHCVPLIYFRMTTPGDIGTFKRLAMTGREERRCTYPRFLKNLDGELIFTYRSGGSGNGKRLYNRYDAKAKTWSPMLDVPLFDGQGKRNAYPHGPSLGADKRFHVVWVWRDTPDCATNHHLSYARSKDLIHWETAAGKPVKLPLTLGQADLCVDPILSGGGIINGCEHLGFDSAGRPMIAYHKSDAKGHMQVYVSRFENGKWVSRVITTWSKRVAFSGRGAMGFIGIRISGLYPAGPDAWYLTYRHRDYGSGRIVISDKTLQPIDRPVAVSVPRLPKAVTRREIDFEGVSVRTCGDIGGSATPGVRYLLKWETLPPNQDRPRRGKLPPAATLKLFKLVAETERR